MSITYIGVDVVKQKLDVADSKTGKHSQIDNSIQGINDSINSWKTISKNIHVVMEATGGYENLFVECVHQADIPCSVVNPLSIR